MTQSLIDELQRAEEFKNNWEHSKILERKATALTELEQMYASAYRNVHLELREIFSNRVSAAKPQLVIEPAIQNVVISPDSKKKGVAMPKRPHVVAMPKRPQVVAMPKRPQVLKRSAPHYSSLVLFPKSHR